ncbi:MAG TPA: HEAT repeat domain-containing protein, partial [Actinomycetota bacterium]|nr:HEAT repeat domain-containing protein [Actinomycetota bacterium]
MRAESILAAVEVAFGPETKTQPAKGEPRVDLTSLRPEDPSAQTTTRSTGPRARHSIGGGRGLAGPSAEERRNALEGILAGGVTPDSVGPVAHLLLTDPDARLRLMAARALAAMRPPPRFELIRRALLDPDDEVRAAVVGLVIRSGEEAIASIVPLVGERAWPLAQQAAVRQLSGFVRETGRLAEPDHDGLLAAVASLDPPPLPSERRALDELARAIGSDRL